MGADRPRPGWEQKTDRRDRAAEARAKAEQARDLHRAAGAELAEYRARIKAVEDRRARRRREGTGPAGG